MVQSLLRTATHQRYPHRVTVYACTSKGCFGLLVVHRCSITGMLEYLDSDGKGCVLNGKVTTLIECDDYESFQLPQVSDADKRSFGAGRHKKKSRRKERTSPVLFMSCV